MPACDMYSLLAYSFVKVTCKKTKHIRNLECMNVAFMVQNIPYYLCVLCISRLFACPVCDDHFLRCTRDAIVQRCL